MYEQLTDYLRKVMPMANSEAKRFHHESIGTEEDEGLVELWRTFGVTLEDARAAVSQMSD